MNEIKSKPMIKLSGNKTSWTLSGRSGIELKSENNGDYKSDVGLVVCGNSIQCGCAHQIQYTVKNTSSDTIKIDHISSGCFDNIGGCGRLTAAFLHSAPIWRPPMAVR